MFFQKKNIIIPINQDKHWSILAVCNANKINEVKSYSSMNRNDPSVEIPFMMHMDSLRYHSSSVVGNNVRQWLNYEWRKSTGVEADILTPANFIVVCPTGNYIMLLSVKSKIFTTILYIYLLPLL
jgi:Ulp1 family protease